MDWWLFWAVLSLSMFQFITCCCAGAGTCTFAEDEFTRSDSTDITTGSSCGWTEDAGDAQIVSNNLAFTSANAKATCATVCPSGPDMSILTYVAVSSLGDIARIDVGDHYIEVKLAASRAGYARLYDGGGTLLAETQNMSFSASKFYQVAICSDTAEGLLSANIPVDGPSAAGPFTGGAVLQANATVSGNTFALGTGGTVTGTVSYLSVTVDQVSASCSHCSYCASCDFGTYPRRMQVVTTGIADRTSSGGTCTTCNDYNATYILDQQSWRPENYRFSRQCKFAYLFTGSCSNCMVFFTPLQCNDVFLELDRTSDRFQVSMGGGLTSIGWIWTDSSSRGFPIDCTTISTTVPAGTDDGCDITSGSTCTISYVP